MAWFWGSGKSEDDSEYESDEYTDGEYSDEEEYETDEEAEEAAVVVEEKEGDQEKVDDDQADEDVNDEKKETDEEPAEKEETDGNKEELESYVEVTKEDAASADNSKDEAAAGEEEVEPKKMRSNSLLDNAETESVEDEDAEETSSIVEEAETEKQEDATEEATTPDETKIVVVDNLPPTDEVVQVETVSSDDGSEFSDSSDEEDERLTSFADKQSMLLLAAEHDRVDILRAILTDEEDANIFDKNTLMNTGIPPLHVAISFGSTNTTSTLLRMGADPSIRPNLEEVKKHYQSHQSKVEIKNMGRFDGISAWELAFGNEAYAKLEATGGTKRSSWVFGSAIQPLENDNGERVIGPLDSIPDFKRQGIEHAFTAEALRCLGGDELDRLKQLVDSGMPATTDIAEKDLYQWAVEMGAMQCEEYLRPVEAAKHTNGDKEGEAGATVETSQADEKAKSISNARVLDRSRPGEDESPSQLRNKLVELDSLASALSTCVDNLAEEVSVCHGLLLMNGGASALASHVKSLKQQKADKEDNLESAYVELETLQERLSDMVQAAGTVGKQVMALSEAELKQQQQQDKEKSAEASKKNEDDESEDSETERFELLDKIAASENRIRKLRISIADLSEESARDLQEVERRGLSGGIDLVRGLRDEMRDVEFQLAEAKSMIATCQAKIRLIRAKASPGTELPQTPPAVKVTESQSLLDADLGPYAMEEGSNDPPKKASQKIATGASQAIAVRAPGNQGFFRIDLWQVILRIIGMNRAADRRAIEAMQRQQLELKKNLSARGPERRPEPVHLMTV